MTLMMMMLHMLRVIFFWLLWTRYAQLNTTECTDERGTLFSTQRSSMDADDYDDMCCRHKVIKQNVIQNNTNLCTLGSQVIPPPQDAILCQRNISCPTGTFKDIRAVVSNVETTIARINGRASAALLQQAVNTSIPRTVRLQFAALPGTPVLLTVGGDCSQCVAPFRQLPPQPTPICQGSVAVNVPLNSYVEIFTNAPVEQPIIVIICSMPT